MNQNSKVAAAIVLRGMAKNGKFAVNSADHAAHKDGVKSAVENGVNKTVLALTGIVKAAVDAGQAQKRLLRLLVVVMRPRLGML
ncbi:variable large family protein [Borreliella andersonii]|uniref:variable large family protein n=1 Tax=Borrelia andersonii TaxID=42109 RepID=UPI003AB54779